MSNFKAKIDQVIDHIKSNRHLQILLIILFVGALLRFYGLHNAENTDEYNEVIEALRVASGEFNIDRWHKKGYQNILAIEYGIYFIIGYVLQIFHSPMDFAAKIIRNMEPLFLIGRYTTASLGTASIALIYFIGKRIYNSRAGIFAALFLALSHVHIWCSHLVNTDIPLAFFFLVSLLFITRFYFSGKIIDYFFAAFFGAVTINMKIVGIGIGVILLITHFIRAKNRNRAVVETIFCKEIYISTVAFISGYLISNPAVIVGFKEWIMSFVWRWGVHTNVYNEVPYAVGGNAYLTYIDILRDKELGLPLFLLLAASIIYAFYKRKEWDLVFLPYLAIMFIIIGSTEFLVQIRYLIVLLVVIFLFGGRFVDEVLSRIYLKGKTKGLALGALGMLVFFFPVKQALTLNISLTGENTGVLAKKWIEANIPPGSKLLIDAGRTMITAGPKINQCRERLEEQLKVIKNLKKGETYDSSQVKIVDSYSAIYFELLLENMPEITYNITRTELGRKVNSPQYYKDNNFNYIIHNEGLLFRIRDPNWRKKYPKSVKFYESLGQEFELVKTIFPTRINAGPAIKIYKVYNNRKLTKSTKMIFCGSLLRASE